MSDIIKCPKKDKNLHKALRRALIKDEFEMTPERKKRMLKKIQTEGT